MVLCRREPADRHREWASAAGQERTGQRSVAARCRVKVTIIYYVVVTPVLSMIMHAKGTARSVHVH